MSLNNINVNNQQIIEVDNEPIAGSDSLVKSGGVYTAFCGNSFGVFVKGSLLKISKFFRELYIVPTFPESFDITAIKSVSIYRGVGSTPVWILGFNNSENVNLSFLRTETNIENQDIITIPAANTNNRFTAYAVVDWSQFANATSVYLSPCEVNDISLSVKNSPYINTVQNIYTKSEVYTKLQTYNKGEIDTKFDAVPN